MGKPEEIKNLSDLHRELMSVTSSLNCKIIDCDEDKKLDLREDYLSRTSMGKHAMEHLYNCMRAVEKMIKAESKILKAEKLKRIYNDKTIRAH